MPFSPTDITGLKVWLDFSDADTLYVDAGTTKVSADGQAIYQANDKSGTGWHAVQATETKRPLYKTNIKNGLSVASYASTDDYLQAAAVDLAQPDTIIAVCYPTAFKYIFDGTTTRQLNEFHNATPAANVHQYAGASVYSAKEVSLNNYFIITNVFNGANSTIKINNNAVAATNPGTNGIKNLLVGARNGGSNNLTGYMLEFLVYNSALSDANVTSLLAYLNAKWAVYTPPTNALTATDLTLNAVTFDAPYLTISSIDLTAKNLTLSAVTFDTPTLVNVSPTPDERIFVIGAESRTFAIDLESREFDIEVDMRGIKITENNETKYEPEIIYHPLVGKDFDLTALTFDPAVIGIGYSWYPTSLTSLVAWYRAETIAGVSDGGGISQWNDESGNAMHGVQATAENQPIYTANEINNLPAVLFDAAGTYKFFALNTHTAFDNIGAPLSFFVVSKGTSTGWWMRKNNAFEVGTVGSTIKFGCPGVKDYFVTFPTTYNSASSYRAVGMELDSAYDVTYSWMNHIRETVTHTADMGHNTNIPYIGAREGTSQSFGGYIAEIIVVRSVTEAERNSIYDYFEEKYGLLYTTSDVERAASTNATSTLDLPTYDGSGFVVHPSVVYTAAGWNGYKYWMVYEGYQSVDYERVHIVASNDGDTWVVPVGITNPIVNAAYSTDADIELDGATMYMLVRDETTGHIELWSSTDGAAWTDVKTLWTWQNNVERSHSLVKTASGWEIYYSFSDGAYRRTAATITGTWSDPVKLTGISVTVDHMDVTLDNGVYFMSNNMGAAIATSDDGLNWYQKVSAILTAGAPGTFDALGFYRASMVRVGATMYLFYCGRGATIWKIGKTTITGI